MTLVCKDVSRLDGCPVSVLVFVVPNDVPWGVMMSLVGVLSGYSAAPPIVLNHVQIL